MEANELQNSEEIKNAIIEDAKIDIGDRGFLQVWLTVTYGGSGQGFGGWVLYLPKSFDHHTIESHAGHFLFRVMEIAGVEQWDKLKGKTIRTIATHSHIRAIGHIVKNDWFDPKKDFTKESQ